MYKILDFLDTWIEGSVPGRPLWNVEQILEGKGPKWNYVDGCMMLAIMKLYHATGYSKYFDFVKGFIDYFVDADGGILGYLQEELNCDSINEGKVLFCLYRETGLEKYKKALDNLYGQIKKQPRNQYGSFWHKKIYEGQVWLDGLYMVSPFYMEYEIEFNNERNYKDVILQFENAQKFMRDKETGLFYHAFDASKKMFWADKETGLSKNFWLRSIGWYLMALVDTTEKIDKMLFYEYELLQGFLRGLIDSILKFIDNKEYMFCQIPNLPGEKGNYFETSGSCAIAYSILKAVRLGYIPGYYYTVGEKIFNSVKQSKLDTTGGNFALKDICLVAGLGGMPGKGPYKLRDGTKEYYFSEPKVENDAKGLAPFLFAYSELLMKGNERWTLMDKSVN
ncbi:MAG: glycoside hydrolase family 88 protein [Clostridiales bacterium]|nr:glycoside hydrolase family 88 protein [Clostridiales bacterium]